MLRFFALFGGNHPLLTNGLGRLNWVDMLRFFHDLQLEPAEPPEYLLHGTVAAKVPSIMEKGLLPMSRNQVHLSVDLDTAMKVGARRRGEVVILRVAAHKMWEDGYRFWESKSGVWLTETVPPEYLYLVKK